MKKLIICVLILQSIFLATVFAGELKSGSDNSYKKPENAQGTIALVKVSLQEYKPKPYTLSEEKLKSLYELAEKNDGRACWDLAHYFYCNDQLDEYVHFIKKGCELLNIDCLYEIIDNHKNQIPCTNSEKEYFRNQLYALGKKGNKDARMYWNLLDDYYEE